MRFVEGSVSDAVPLKPRAILYLTPAPPFSPLHLIIISTNFSIPITLLTYYLSLSLLVTSFSVHSFFPQIIQSNPIPQANKTKQNKKTRKNNNRKMQREREKEDHQDQQQSNDKDSPSFRLIQMDSPERISAAAAHDHSGHIDHESDDDFEFSFIRIPEARPPIAAGDIFSDGKIRPVYPIFNRDLLLNLDLDAEHHKNEAEEKESKSIRLPLRRLFIEEEREQASFSSTSSSASSSSSSLEELDGIAPGTYCVWTPPNKNDRCKKSSSTGSSPSLRWRLKDLVVGKSQSNGKEKFVFIPIQEEEAKKLEKNNSGGRIKGKKLSGKSTTEVDVVTAQQRMTTAHYGHGHGQRNGQEVGRGSGRKSFLPYKPDLVGFFASVNELSRSHNPF